MIKVFLATKNEGKINELKRVAGKFSIDVVNSRYPLVSNQSVNETGSTFEENAKLKYDAAIKNIEEDDVYIIADDSGIQIPALNDEPGVFTKRWAGYEMTDDEILNYCLQKMKGLKGDKREARFITTLAVGRKGGDMRYFYGSMSGRILDAPVIDAPKQSGFPFRPLFFIPELNKMIYELNDSDIAKGFKTHRQLAFENALRGIKNGDV